MPRAVLCTKTARIVACRGIDHILHRGIGGRGRIAKMGCGTHRFAGKVGLARSGWCGRGIVIPDPSQHAFGIGGCGTRAVTGNGPTADALTVLGHRVIPTRTANAIKELLLDGSFARGIIAVPLGSPIDQIDLVRSGFHAHAAGAAVIAQI